LTFGHSIHRVGIAGEKLDANVVLGELLWASEPVMVVPPVTGLAAVSTGKF